MRQPVPVSAPPVVTLRLHVIALVRQLLLRSLPGTFFLLLGTRWSQVVLVFIGLTLIVCLDGAALFVWRSYRVHVRYDRILVRRRRLAAIEEIIYPIPGLRGLTRRQSFMGWLVDTGTLTIALPDRTVRLAMLTPFSATAGVVGFDC